ncbi:MAG: hemerythrin domain-containing protein [Alphaproteobacteria bacterium]|nr:hemerythrin domain-containing protein [Alphaproteobacteria bacterium]
MPNARPDPNTATGRAARGREPPRDALELLSEDHRTVEDLFEEFESEDDTDALGALATRICAALRVHTQIEEEIFYPEARTVADDDTLDEAEVEHEGARRLIEDISRMQPTDPLFRAKVKVLGEYVKHHVREEEQELFAEVRDGDLDLDDMGARLAARKAELERDAQTA